MITLAQREIATHARACEQLPLGVGGPLYNRVGAPEDKTVCSVLFQIQGWDGKKSQESKTSKWLSL